MGRSKDPIWDTICEVFGLKPTTKSECTRVGKIVSSLRAKDATEILIKANCNRWPSMFPGATLTPDALLKHWDQLCVFIAKPDFPGMPKKREFDIDQQSRCLILHGEEFLRNRCQNEGFECILDMNSEIS